MQVDTQKSAHRRRSRRLPVGAEPLAGGEVHFRVWAPEAAKVEVFFGKNAVELDAESAGYFSGIAKAQGGTNYRYRLNANDSFPDPTSPFQPEGPHGPSQIIDPLAYQWTDRDWQGVSSEQIFLYEMLIGTFTPQGTWTAAESQLDELASLGFTNDAARPK